MAVGLLAMGMCHSFANPTGGQVAAGSASINTVPGTVTINQLSNIAIINWQSFSIGAGQLTKFVQPSSSSAALNRVLGGQTSFINGTLSANGQIYLINGNGVVIGPGGVVCANSFTASTRDISNCDFLSGNLHFTGGSDAGVQNLGKIEALGGDVYLIGKTVDNEGLIEAPNGTVGLAAGDDVLLAQQNADGSTVTVNSSSHATGASGQTAVSNSGTIRAMSAELTAANGNLYALAINNSGVIRATTVQHQGGHVYLTANSGTVLNSGTINVSATARQGQGGSVLLKSERGTAINSGNILAEGGRGGVGGNVDISGKAVQITGTVNTTAACGTTGTLLIDPGTWTVAATGGDETGADVAAQLSENNVVINACGTITISDGITWTNGNTLTLSTNMSGSQIVITAPISGVNGGLIVDTAGVSDVITDSASLNVAAFILQNGSWTQNSATLPAFQASDDFEIDGGSFLRVAGGDGSSGNPYVITDVYGLQGIASLPMGNSYVLGNDIDATGTATWNLGAGFVPIGGNEEGFNGTFNGQGYTINGLFINMPSSSFVGLFGGLNYGGTVENVGVSNVVVYGSFEVGGLVGGSNGLITDSYSTGVVTAGNSGSFVGGLVGGSSGTISNAFSTAVVSGNNYVGGLVGANGGGIINDSYSAGPVVALGSENYNVGGLLGGNLGTVNNSFWDTTTAVVTRGFGGDPTNTTPGITGATTAQLESETFIIQNSATSPAWNFTNVWTTNEGTQTPQLTGVPISGAPPVVSGGSSPTLPLSTFIIALDSFDAEEANEQPPLININFSLPGIGVGFVSLDNPDGGDGSINDGSGSGKKGTNIASGSSTSGVPSPNRLITAGSGISSIFHGGVISVQPLPIVLQKIEFILNENSENELSHFVFGAH
ncbi:MAG TPA: filamentous hemagglutinin N-terminal domain-containing protein [Candidatus Methylacidiphilales bacterium]|jgi:filamentous hemagglutinin family protein|nr:filamentous hemagglutinin N-terminal domain-containing protein [Candidatus Methylacidiphilales bacterium]